MKTLTLLLALTVSTPLGCGGAPFTASDSLAMPTDTGSTPTTDVVTATTPDDAGLPSSSSSGGAGSVSEDGAASDGGAAPEADSANLPVPDAATDVAHATADAGNECAPGATECTSDTQVQTCTASGQWGAATTCPYACVGGTCGGVCVPGTTQCDYVAPLEEYVTLGCLGTGQWSGSYSMLSTECSPM